jgi:hypothetical protein
MQLILNGDTRPVLFFMAQSGDHISGLIGAAPAVTISRNGGAFAAPAGTVAEVGNGWYGLTPAGADATTNGVLLLHATATGGDPADVKAQVVAFDPYAAFPTLAAIQDGVLNDALTESYAANGEPATLAQLLYGISAVMSNISQSGATLTASRLDGVTPAMSFTLDSATAPTSRRRAA